MLENNSNTTFDAINYYITLKGHYAKTEVFIIDEVNALSAATLAQLDDTMRTVFENTGKPFGGKKMIFLGDPAQLKPVFGEPVYGNPIPVMGAKVHKGKIIFIEMS